MKTDGFADLIFNHLHGRSRGNATRQVWYVSRVVGLGFFDHDRITHQARPVTTDISPVAFRVGFTVICTSCPSAVRNSISRPTEKLPARLRISADTCGCWMPRALPACTWVR